MKKKKTFTLRPDCEEHLEYSMKFSASNIKK